MRKIFRQLLVAAVSILAAQAALAGTIAGSKHDFSTVTGAWAGGQICLPCHAPHNNKNLAGELLWNHTNSVATYTMYSSPTLTPSAVVTAPSGVSKLCLSCHDGTVALDNYGTRTPTAGFITGTANFGTNLTNDHPISFTYDAALVTADGALKATTTAVTIGAGAQTKTGTIASAMLVGNKLECSSCHDVHNTFTAVTAGLLKITNASSALCLTCHIK